MVTSSLKTATVLALLLCAPVVGAQPTPVPQPAQNNPWAGEPTPTPTPTPTPVSPTPTPTPTPTPAMTPMPPPTAAPNGGAAISSEDVDTGPQDELPWFLPPAAAKKSDPYHPYSLAGFYGRTSLSGSFFGDSSEIGIIGQLQDWVSLGIGLQSMQATLVDSDTTLPPLMVDASLLDFRMDLGRYSGYEVYHQDKLRLFVSFPALTFALSTNAWESEHVTTLSGQLRFVGVRAQICPGIHIDLNAPIYSKWMGTASRPVSPDPYADTLDWVATGSSWGIELEAGFTFWRAR